MTLTRTDFVFLSLYYTNRRFNDKEDQKLNHEEYVVLSFCVISGMSLNK